MTVVLDTRTIVILGLLAVAVLVFVLDVAGVYDKKNSNSNTQEKD